MRAVCVLVGTVCTQRSSSHEDGREKMRIAIVALHTGSSDGIPLSIGWGAFLPLVVVFVAEAVPVGYRCRFYINDCTSDTNHLVLLYNTAHRLMLNRSTDHGSVRTFNIPIS